RGKAVNTSTTSVNPITSERWRFMFCSPGRSLERGAFSMPRDAATLRNATRGIPRWQARASFMISLPAKPTDPKYMAMHIGFIGPGVRGTPMAGHLANAGHSLTVLDVDRAKAERLAAAHSNVVVAPSPREVAEAADVVVTMLPSGEYVRDV